MTDHECKTSKGKVVNVLVRLNDKSIRCCGCYEVLNYSQLADSTIQKLKLKDLYKK